MFSRHSVQMHYLVACWALWCMPAFSQQSAPPRVTDGSPLNSRPLHIDGADASIVKATVAGPEFGVSNLFVGVEDRHPVAKRLRDEYRLDDVIKVNERVSEDSQAASLGS